MIVSLCLAAIDCHLSGRPAGRSGCGCWPRSAGPRSGRSSPLYAIWAWRTIPAMRRMMVWGLVLHPLFWFGIPALTAKSAFIAGSNALNSPRELHSNKVFGTIDRFFELHAAPMWIAALLRDRARALPAPAVHPAARRRDRRVGGRRDRVRAPRLAGGPALSVRAGRRRVRARRDLRRARDPRAAAAAGAGCPAPLATGDRLGDGVVVLLFAGTFVPAARSRLRVERGRPQARASASARRSAGSRPSSTGSAPRGSSPAASRICRSATRASSPGTWASRSACCTSTRTRSLLHPHTTVDFFPLHNGWRVFPSHVTAATRSLPRAAPDVPVVSAARRRPVGGIRNPGAVVLVSAVVLRRRRDRRAASGGAVASCGRRCRASGAPPRRAIRSPTSPRAEPTSSHARSRASGNALFTKSPGGGASRRRRASRRSAR